MKEVKFIFNNAKAADHFLAWLSGSGEQSYWDWMEYREQDEEKGNITVLEFDYWQNDQKGFGKGDIVCKCGRLNR